MTPRAGPQRTKGVRPATFVMVRSAPWARLEPRNSLGRLTLRRRLFLGLVLLGVESHHLGDDRVDVLGALLLRVLHDPRADRHPRLHGEVVLVRLHPRHRSLAADVEALEPRRDVAGEE